jgi:hypothetical protein
MSTNSWMDDGVENEGFIFVYCVVVLKMLKVTEVTNK